MAKPPSQLQRTQVRLEQAVCERVIDGRGHHSVQVRPQVSVVNATDIKPRLYGQHIGPSGIRRFEQIAEARSIVRGTTVVDLFLGAHRLEATIFWMAQGGAAPYAALYEFSSPQIDRLNHPEPVVLDLDVEVVVTDDGRKVGPKQSLEWLYAMVNATLDWKCHVRDVLPVPPRADTLDLRDCCVLSEQKDSQPTSGPSLPELPPSHCQDPERCGQWQSVTLEHDDAPNMTFTGRLIASVDDLEEQLDDSARTQYTRYQLYETPLEHWVAVVSACSTHPADRTINHSRVCGAFSEVTDWLGDQPMTTALLAQATDSQTPEAKTA